MKWSDALVAEVPLGFVTVTSTVAAEPAGDTIVSDVSEEIEMLVPEVAPNFTDVAVRKPVPVTVTVVPPRIEPTVGLTDLQISPSQISPL